MSNLDKMDHLVVLMLENRSFDSLCGYLYEGDAPAHFIGEGPPAFDGVAGKQLSNPGPDGREVPVRKAAFETQAAMCNPCPDPGETLSPHVSTQLYGAPRLGDAAQPAPMNGFVLDYLSVLGRADVCEDDYRIIMDCFTPQAVPVLSGLARAYAVSDWWFCSVPSQTFCNRSFVHSGQSHGFVQNEAYAKWLGNQAPTIFNLLSNRGVDWAVYFDAEDLLSVTRALHPPLWARELDGHFRAFSRLRADCEAGRLPAYSFIEPRFFVDHNDMHPPVASTPGIASSVLAGEILINEVYETLRSNPAVWERTLLVIVFDEHGGSYDHVPPPAATPPEAAPSYPLEDGFGFDRFGVRVPAILVSPYIDAGTVVRAGGAVPFDHTSVIGTLCERWGLPALGGRSAAAPSLAPVLARTEPRRDSPTFTPRPYQRACAPLWNGLPLSSLQRNALAALSGSLGAEVPQAVHTIGDALAHLSLAVQAKLR